MQHITDDDLILRYYGENGACDEEHLSACPECRARLQSLQRVLNVVEIEVPARPSSYGEEVWARLEPKLPVRKRSRSWLRLGVQRWLAVAALATVVVAAFLGGRHLPVPSRPDVAAAPPRERVLVVAVGEHLERSQMVLAELVNAEPASGPVDIADERTMAKTLLSANRLYRTAAESNGDLATSALLDDIERVLVDVANSPDAISTGDLDSIRERVERQGLLFKIRVVESRLRHEAPEAAAGEKL